MPDPKSPGSKKPLGVPSHIVAKQVRNVPGTKGSGASAAKLGTGGKDKEKLGPGTVKTAGTAGKPNPIVEKGKPVAVNGPSLVGHAKPGNAKHNSVPVGAGDNKKKDDKVDDKQLTVEDKKEKVHKAHQAVDKGDMKGEYGKRVFVHRLMRGMLPLRWFLTLFGHFPMSYKVERSGSYTFRFSWLSFRTFLFLISGSLSFYTLFVGGLNFAIVVLSEEPNIFGNSSLSPFARLEQAELFYESALLKRHFMWTMSILAAVIHSVIVFFHLFTKRHYIASIYTYQTQISQHLHMDISDGTFWTSIILIGILLSTLLAILLMACLQFAPVAIGTPTLFGIFLLRLFVNEEGLWIDRETQTRRMVQIFGGVSLMIIYISSKCHILMFVYHCKLLRNAFATWNGRLYVTVKKGGKYILTEEGRTTFILLYKDHTTLLDLMEGTNRIFATIIESYYALQTATIFFEIYFFLRTAKYGDNKFEAVKGGGTYFIRDNDWLPGLLLTFQSVAIALITVKIASDVGEEAMAGVDILRRKTMLGRKTDAELLFQLSLKESYNSYQRFDIFGGGYQYLNKDWIMGYINNVMGYFIILYQFQPVMDFNTDGNWRKRLTLGEFYTNLENVVPRGHWKSTENPPPVTYQTLNA